MLLKGDASQQPTLRAEPCSTFVPCDSKEQKSGRGITEKDTETRNNEKLKEKEESYKADKDQWIVMRRNEWGEEKSQSFRSVNFHRAQSSPYSAQC